MRLNLDAIALGFLVGSIIGLLLGFIVLFGPIITGGPWFG